MITAYTDGSSGKDGSGGWGFAAICDNVIVTEQSGRETETTNNRMELMAIIKAMQWMLSCGYSQQIIITDSQYSRMVLTRHDTKLKTNTDLIYTGRSLLGIVLPDIQWVKGHNGNRWNEYVDQLCVGARKRPENTYLSDDLSLTPRRRV